MDAKNAVSRTLAYSNYFSFPLFPQEVHYWLITEHKTPFSVIKKIIPPISFQNQKLRYTLSKNSLKKKKIAHQLVKKARHLWGIEMIALTGSVAIDNAKTTDDIDLLIVTKPHTLWLIRPLFLILLGQKFARRHPQDNPNQIRNTFCPNLWLDLSSLSVPQEKRSLYTAHEVLQTKPLFDRGGVYQNFLQANRWTSRYLANAYSNLASKTRTSPPKNSPFLILISPFNFIAYLMQSLYMSRRKTTEFITLHSAYFHKINLSQTLKNYLQKNCL